MSQQMPYWAQVRAARSIVAVIGLTGIWLFCWPLHAQGGSSLHSFEVWQTEQGLPYSAVTSIVQTRDGYLWLGTYNGLVRFDGVRFTVFDTANTPEFDSSRITSLFEDSEGALWIGHETGELTKLFKGRFSRVLLGETWPGGQIIGLEKDRNGILWLMNDSGILFSLPGAKFQVAGNTGWGLPSLARDKDGEIWVVRGGFLGLLEQGRLEPLPLADRPNINNVQKACASRDGGLWLVGDGRVRKWTRGKPVVDWGPAPWNQTFLSALLETASGVLVAGTVEDGLFLLSPDGTFEHFTRQNGLSHDWVRCLSEDREGNVWVGTGGGGLDALRTRNVEMVKAPDDWQGRSVLSVTTCSDGGLWVGTEGAGLYRFQDGTATRFTSTNGLLNSFVWTVLEDRQHKLWAGTWGGGLFIRQGETFGFPAGLENLNAPTTALVQDRNGTMWVGTESGLLRYQNGICASFGRKDGLALPNVRAIVEDAAGTIWFGMSGGGLGRLQDGKLTQFRRSDGLASDFVWSLLAEDDGTLWIGTFGGGLCRRKNGRFATISTEEGLPNNVICHIADDGKGSFWMSSYAGIFRARKDELNLCADGRLKAVNCLAYGKTDGLSTLECSGGFQPSGCKTPDGKLWFPTTKGLAVIDPNSLRNNPIPPPVVIEELVVDRQRMVIPEADGPALSPSLRIAPGKQRFEFRYTGLSLTMPQKVRFKYRLDKLDPDWIDAGTGRTAIYSYIKPGNYIFRVIACNNDNVWNETGAALALTVLPYFWQTRWFSAGAILGGAGVVGGAARYSTRRRLRHKMERLERQRAVEKERARIAKDIHDDLGASLTRITLLSQSDRAESEDPRQAAADLGQIYQTARQLTRALDEIVWAVSPQHDTLDSLVSYLGKFAQDFLSVAGIRCRLNVPMQLPPWPLTAEVRHNLFLAFKETLHNVLKHAAATEVRVSLTLAESSFFLFIEDNGKGFDPPCPGQPAAPGDNKNSLRISNGNGLSNMRKRLEEIGGICELHSACGEGTRVKFTCLIRK